MSLDTDVLIIGAGMSGVGFAVQLQKSFPQANYEIHEKLDNLSGTWWANTYPGCGCDVASHLYSYSFALKSDWSRKYALQPEIAEYFHSVAARHGVTRHTTYKSTVQTAVFEESTGTWLVTVLDQKTNRIQQRRAKVLISAVGALSIPKECDIKGKESFKGKFFHSAQWDHSFDWADKEVVVIGNGCSATQFVPILTGGKGKVKKLTQFSRQPHWLAERPNPYYSPFFKWSMKYVPLAMRLYRFYHYYLMEADFSGFYLESGQEIRKELTKTQLDYMKRTAPAKYHAALTPDTEIGCKRKVMDTDYLSCLHRENMELVSSDPVTEITETGIRTRSGEEIRADAIVLATGFQTQQLLYPLEIKGEKGTTLNEHWDEFSGGLPQAYFGTCVSQFPNFFVMMGPNTATGHLSVIYTTECQINFTLRVIRPVLQTLYPSLLSTLNPLKGDAPDTVAVTPDAEHRDNEWIQTEVQKFVWSSGCRSWYVDEETGRNTLLYPDWQWKYWLRSIFIPFRTDFVFGASPVRLLGRNLEQKKDSRKTTTLLASGGGIVLAVFLAAKYGDIGGARATDLVLRRGHELCGVVRSAGSRLLAQ